MDSNAPRGDYEEDGLGPSFCAYTSYITVILHRRVSTRAGSRASEKLSAYLYYFVTKVTWYRLPYRYGVL